MKLKTFMTMKDSDVYQDLINKLSHNFGSLRFVIDKKFNSLTIFNKLKTEPKLCYIRKDDKKFILNIQKQNGVFIPEKLYDFSSLYSKILMVFSKHIV